MLVLITGSRTWDDAKLIYRAMKALNAQTDAIIEGEAQGADSIARIIADLRDIPVRKFPADWCDFGSNVSATIDPKTGLKGQATSCKKQHVHSGRRAGILRNEQMLKELQGSTDHTEKECWVFSDDLATDRGTSSMMFMASGAGIKIKKFSHANPTGGPEITKIEEEDDFA